MLPLRAPFVTSTRCPALDRPLSKLAAESERDLEGLVRISPVLPIALVLGALSVLPAAATPVAQIPTAATCLVRVILDGDDAMLPCPTDWYQTPAATPTATEVATSTPTASATVPPATSTATSTVTATVPATATASATATATPGLPVSGQQCPQAIHDAITTTGPDGRQYPTWHPPVDPSGCWFGHEHGADPASVNAGGSPPAFGYVGGLIGDNEPHPGFKVTALKNGQRTDDGRLSTGDYRVTFHMGTGGVARYTTRFHSIEVDYIARDGSGREVHLKGMADTGNGTGSTCTNPRDGGKDFSELGCPDTYEPWAETFQVKHPDDQYQGLDQARASVLMSIAVFDPITTRNPAAPLQLIYTRMVKGDGGDPLSPSSQYRGCQRESYFGGVFLNNAGKPAFYWTNVYGVVDKTAPAAGKPGLIKQIVSTIKNPDNTQFKYRQDFCSPTVRSPN